MNEPKKLYLELEKQYGDPIDYENQTVFDVLRSVEDSEELIEERFVKIAVYELKEIIEAKIKRKVVTQKVSSKKK